jgi:beta-mannanase
VAAESVAVVDVFASNVAAPVGAYEWYQAWGDGMPFDATRATAAADRGALPVLTWEPWAPGAGVQQPAYTLARIGHGSHDEYVTGFARQVRDWGGQVAVRFLHELNAPTYPWGVGVNGNTAAEAVTAWKHVRAVFDREGVRNVVWVWSVNVHAPGTTPYAEIYPGDDAVDWVAVDGYNGGTALPWGGWRSPRELFGTSMDDLRVLSDRPLAITEVGSAEQGGDKAAWVDQLFRLAVERRVRVLIWFQYAKEADWRVNSSPRSAAAFRRAAGVPGRLGPPPLPSQRPAPG